MSRLGGLRTSLRYTVPEMPFSLSVSQAADLANRVPGIRAVKDVPMSAGRGALLDTAVWALYRTPIFDGLRPCLTLLEFG